MKKSNLLKLLFGAWMMVATIAFTGCVDDNEDTGAPFLNVTPENLMFGEDGQPVDQYNGQFIVESNRPWRVTVEEDASWVTILEVSGEGDAAVPVSVPAYAGGRNAKVTFSIYNSYGTLQSQDVYVVQGDGVPVEKMLIYKETFGEVSEGDDGWPMVNNYDGWAKSGEGSADVTYAGENASVRGNLVSSSWSSYEGSGGANIMFGKTPTNFIVKNIALTPEQTKLQLTFGLSYYQAASIDLFQNFYVQLSADGERWTDNVPYSIDFVAGNNWDLATIDFTLMQPSEKLFVKFYAEEASKYRIDDITLTTGDGGAEVDLTTGTIVPDEVTVTTAEALVLSGTSAQLGGTLSTAATVTEVGVQYIANAAEIDWTKATSLSTKENISASFHFMVENLTEGATYAARAYAVYGEGSTAYGEVVTFTPKNVETGATIASLVAYAQSLNVEFKKTAALSAYIGKSVTGVIAANNEAGNLYNMISVVDNDGKPNSGLLLYGSAYNSSKDFPVGAKITLTVNDKSVVENYNGLLEFKDLEATVDASQTVEIVAPKLTVAEANGGDYIGMYIEVTGVKNSNTQGVKTWFSGDKNAYNQFFSDGTNKLIVRTSKYAEFANYEIDAEATGSIFGVAQVYSYDGSESDMQLFPVRLSDIAAFSEVEDGPDDPVVPGDDPITSDADIYFTLNTLETQITDLTQNGYGAQVVADPATWLKWTAGEIEFTGVKVCKANADYPHTIQMQGNASDAAKQAIIQNVTAIEGMTKIKVTFRSYPTKFYEPTFTMTLGTAEATPTKTKTEGTDYHTWVFEYTVPAGVTSFKLHNNTQGALYMEKFEIFKGEPVAPTTPNITGVTPAEVAFTAEGGSQVLTVAGENLDGKTITATGLTAPFAATVEGTIVTVTAPANATAEALSQTLTIAVEGGNSVTVPVSQAAGEALTPITGPFIFTAKDLTFAESGYGDQKVDDRATWLNWTIGGAQFTGVKLMENNGNIQLQGNASDAGKQAIIENVTPIENLSMVRVSFYSGATKFYAPEYTMTIGTEVVTPTVRVIEDPAYFTFVHEYAVPAGATTFQLHNNTQGALYISEIAVYNDGTTPDTTPVTPNLTGTDPASVAFTADGGSQSISILGAGYYGNTITLSGLTEPFSAEYTEGTPYVTVKAAKNETTAALNQTLTIAVEGGNSVTVAVSQEAGEVPAAGTQTVVLDFTDKNSWPADFPQDSKNKATAKATYTFGGYDFAFEAPAGYCAYPNNTPPYFLFGKQGAYVEFPVVEGKKLTKVTCNVPTGASAKVNVSVTDAEGNIPTGGEEQNWVKPESGDRIYTYELSGTDAATKYRLYVANANNAQLLTLTLEYTE